MEGIFFEVGTCEDKEGAVSVTEADNLYYRGIMMISSLN